MNPFLAYLNYPYLVQYYPAYYVESIPTRFPPQKKLPSIFLPRPQQKEFPSLPLKEEEEEKEEGENTIIKARTSFSPKKKIIFSSSKKRGMPCKIPQTAPIPIFCLPEYGKGSFVHLDN